MSKHTPGPWWFDRENTGLEVFGADGRFVMIMDRSTEELFANARLIAAAPELHEALRQIILLDDNMHPGLASWHEARAKAHEAARAVLAKVDA